MCIRDSWKESTSTSPSGLHLGHYKCPFKHVDEDDRSSLATRLYNIKAHFVNLSLRYGIIYKRWLQINAVMIEKIPGIYHIDKLRPLHIFEGDLNGILGILWGRRLMANAERHSLLHDAQYGSRKGKGIDICSLASDPK